MKRRTFISGLGSAAAWPLAARAQQGDRVRRIGVLDVGNENDPVEKTYVSAFTQALASLGWTGGRNLRMDVRWGGGDINRIRAFAKEFGRLATGHHRGGRLDRRHPRPPARDADDPNRLWERGRPRRQRPRRARLDRPSGNLTGFANFEASLGGKWLELLSEIAPGLKRAAFIFNSDTAAATASPYMPSLEAAARSVKVVPIIAPVYSDVEIEAAIVALGRDPGGGLVVPADVFTSNHRALIIFLAARNNIPAVYYLSIFARDGGLLSYGSDIVDIFRRSSSYVDRILRGAKPVDLPVQLPTKFEMAVNLKTAKALGLTVPQSILLTADEVIE